MSTKAKLKLKKMKTVPNILHVDTDLVLNSLEDKIVIGKYHNNKIVLLNKTDIELCDKWKLSYDNDKIKNDEDEDEEEEEEDEEVDDKEDNKEEDNKNEDKDEDDEKEDEKEDENNKDNISSKYILDITTQFTKDIHSHFDTVNYYYTGKILDYENKISNIDNEYRMLLSKFNTECNAHSSTKEDFKKLQAKFEGIKSLFN